ncbi:hypothetical protein OG429_39940 [Streptomyces sp. NBC_00190]|nr:hypothetical protein OG239_00935 [Streptomyces sp. NBC_00868]
MYSYMRLYRLIPAAATRAPGHAQRFPQGRDPVVPFGQVVQRAEQQHRVVRTGRSGQVAGVAQLGRASGIGGGLFQVAGYRVDEVATELDWVMSGLFAGQ